MPPRRPKTPQRSPDTEPQAVGSAAAAGGAAGARFGLTEGWFDVGGIAEHRAKRWRLLLHKSCPLRSRNPVHHQNTDLRFPCCCGKPLTQGSEIVKLSSPPLPGPRAHGRHPCRTASAWTTSSHVSGYRSRRTRRATLAADLIFHRHLHGSWWLVLGWLRGRLRCRRSGTLSASRLKNRIPPECS